MQNLLGFRSKRSRRAAGERARIIADPLRVSAAKLFSLICLSLSILPSHSAAAVPAKETKRAEVQHQQTPARLFSDKALTRSDLEPWLDGFMQHALSRGNIAGATVAVVKDGTVLLTKGYGFSDVENRIPVSPEQTLFRPASIGKLVTWTAVMQLAEQGRLDLDADVNQYLDFKLPDRPDGPVTLRHIMTHTAGFEEAMRELITSDPSIVGLERGVKRWIPERVYPAGTTPAYSNYGAALAGYIVQRISGMSFERYVERHIFQPLGMHRSSFRQPLPAQLARMVSKGYPRASEKPKPYEYSAFSPAGSLVAPATDMATFMLAHLQGGAANGNRILRPETVRMMHTTGFEILPPLNRMTLGFFQTNVNGRRVIGHSGDTQLFHSDLNLFLDENVGYFVSFNSSGSENAAGRIRSAFFHAFADRYFPGEYIDGSVPQDVARRHAELMAGDYQNSRRAHSSFAALAGFLDPVQIEHDGNGHIVVPRFKDVAGEPRKWREIAPFVWREVGGDLKLAAEVVDGRVRRFSVDNAAPIMVYDRSPWWRSGLLRPAAYLAIAALLLTVVFWPVGALVRRRFGARSALSSRDLRVHRGVRMAAAATLLAGFGWMAVLVGSFSSSGVPESFDTVFYLVSTLTAIALGSGLALSAWDTWLIWKRQRNWPSRIWAVVLVFAFAMLIWLAMAWQLLSFSKDF